MVHTVIGGHTHTHTHTHTHIYIYMIIYLENKRVDVSHHLDGTQGQRKT